MRKVLLDGTVLFLCGRKYVIDAVIGTGASCVAYEAHRIREDGTESRCRIKECYPYNAEIMREGNALVWKSVDEKQKAFQRFRNGFSVLNTLRNRDRTGNNITGSELFEDNGSLYSVMEINYGITLDKDDNTDLQSMVDLFLVLIKAVGNLHKEGYLHLDLKPENLLISYDPSPYIWFFDTDTIVPIDELNSSGKVSLSYSPSWAAPEQTRRNAKHIGPWTDIFAIGAMLYYKTVGCLPKPEDTGLFSSVSFPVSIEESENPRAIHLLGQIIHKAIAAGINRRYRNTEEMYTALKEVSDTLHAGKPYIKSVRLEASSFFAGREKEIGLIRDRLFSGMRYLIVYGCGGIGKSELVKQYAVRYRDRYTLVLFLRYRDTLKDTLLNAPIENYDGSEEDKLNRIYSFLGEDTLVIIDNYDVSVEKENELSALIQSGTDLLVTSRTDFSTVLPEKHLFELDVLPRNALKEIYTYYSRSEINSPGEEKALKAICESVGYHTYAVELLARHAAFCGAPIVEVSDSLKAGIMAFSRDEKVIATKDNQVIRNSLPEIIRVLFRLSSLTNGQKQVLRNLSYLDFIVITKREYITSLGAQPKEMVALNELIELGLVRTRQAGAAGCVIELHPLILETVRDELKPTLRKCPQIYRFIESGFLTYNWPSWEDLEIHTYTTETAVKYEYESHCRFFLRFFANCDMTEDKAIELFNKWTDKSFENFYIGHPYGEGGEERLWRVPEANEVYSDDYNRIAAMLRRKKRKTSELFFAQLAVLYAWLQVGGYTYIDNKDKLNEKRCISTDRAFFDCLRTAEKTDDSVELEIKWLVQAVVISSRAYCNYGITEEVALKCKELAARYPNILKEDDYPELFDENMSELVGLMFLDEMQKKYDGDWKSDKKKKTPDHPLSLKEEYYERFNGDKDENSRLELIQQLVCDSRLSSHDILDSIDTFLDEMGSFSWQVMIQDQKYIDGLKQKDFSKYNAIVDFCYDHLNNNSVVYLGENRDQNTECFLDAIVQCLENRLITACCGEDRDMVDKMLNHILALLRVNYQSILDKEQEFDENRPFTMFPYFSHLIEILYNTKFINYTTMWTVTTNIDVLEIQRRIPEHLPAENQERIDRMLADSLHYVLYQIEKVLELLPDYPDELVPEDIEKIRQYKVVYRNRLNEIIDKGFEIKEEPGTD